MTANTLGDELVKHGYAYMLEQQEVMCRTSRTKEECYAEVAAMTVGYLAWQMDEMINRALAAPLSTKAVAALVPPAPEVGVP